MIVASDKYLATIGVECHVQFKTKTKLFSGVDNDARTAPPNTLISHICFGLPGSLPVLNEKAIKIATRAAFAFNTRPQKFSQFDRKHYFYPDLPKGYQITQYAYPIIADGFVEIIVDGKEKKINLTRAHLEEDAGKSVHPVGADYSLIDLNRAGTPLLEVVSEPEMHSSKEVKAYVRELYLLMKYADVSEANLYYGNIRFDVNVSVSRDKSKLGTRSETKNLNSFRSVEKAVDYEIKRQIELLEKGQSVVQETRGWDDSKQKTFSQRSKEEVHDYRYFPEPDLPPVTLSDKYIDEIKLTMPILPPEIRRELLKIGLSPENIEILLGADKSSEAGGYVSRILSLKDQPNVAHYAANWMINRHLVNPQNDSDEPKSSELKLPSEEQFAEVYQLHVKQKKLSSNNADRLLFKLLLDKNLSPLKLAQQNGFLQISDETAIGKIVSKVIEDNPKTVNEVKAGEIKAVKFLVGQVMKESKGQANPSLAEQLIKSELKI